MRSLEGERYVTKNYYVLQGLKQVPTGSFLIGIGDHFVLKHFLPPAPNEGSSAVR